jgi:hypothetical protein
MPLPQSIGHPDATDLLSDLFAEEDQMLPDTGEYVVMECQNLAQTDSQAAADQPAAGLRDMLYTR